MTEFDTLGASPYEPLGDVLSRVRAAVADTGPLMNDVMKSSARGQPSPLCSALQIGLVRAYAPFHVWAEVPRGLEKQAKRLGLSYAELEWVWWNWYVPHIRFVDCADLPRSRAYRRLAERDPTDPDTVSLFEFIAPAVLLAEDGDILESGFAYEDWREFYDVTNDISSSRAQLMASSFGLALTGRGIASAGRGVLRLTSTPASRWVGLAAVAAVAVAVLRWRRPINAAWVKHRSAIGQMLSNTVTLITAFVHKLKGADAKWNAAQRGSAGTSIPHRIGASMATSPEPLTTTELVHALDLNPRKLGFITYARRLTQTAHSSASAHTVGNSVARAPTSA